LVLLISVKHPKGEYVCHCPSSQLASLPGTKAELERSPSPQHNDLPEASHEEFKVLALPSVTTIIT
jgi:hypothetical protein